jgi:predicted enzyme related to lactoylglutathione lyase
MPRVIHFEIAADEPERAAKFYSQIFGWKIHKWEGPVNYWLVTTGEGGPGINGALKERPDPAVSTVNTIDIPSLDEFLPRIREHGGKVVMPKRAIPGIGYHAYCQDTECNIFGIMEEDSTAR